MALANCSCGTTLAISSRGIGLFTMWRLLRWARKRSRERGITVSQLLAWLRGEIDRQVLGGQSSVQPPPHQGSRSPLK